ncbi:hypothetical protein [Massilia sp. CCM 8734]|uniref:hypothetical protein n=1 Tax=Massilia sp. CCM 8734 TaxID=2609283 RepID=UPI00141F28D2|nr:hypothetical protein [Massilia sp. CCM 8734]NHZ94334.1 hypothetical protein [Massilia sp. CCM 8734]
MTLGIDAYYIDEHGKQVDLPLSSALGGVESTRYSFYAGEKAIAAGLVLFPLLATEMWIEARGAELAILKREAHVMLGLLEDKERAYWEFRLGNILEAIELATPYGENGIVSIG